MLSGGYKLYGVFVVVVIESLVLLVVAVLRIVGLLNPPAFF